MTIFKFQIQMHVSILNMHYFCSLLKDFDYDLRIRGVQNSDFRSTIHITRKKKVLYTYTLMICN
jgi:hypothetical protein